MQDSAFDSLTAYMTKIPAVNIIGKGFYEEGTWWVKFGIAIEHPLSWQVVQELACVVNYLSINERLPTRFYPVSPAPYLNGGPSDFLSWIIENTDKEFEPDILMKWFESRLPQPVDEVSSWEL